MLGGFLAYTFTTMLGIPYILALLPAVAGAFLFGIVTDRIAFRPLIRSAIILGPLIILPQQLVVLGGTAIVRALFAAFSA